ncbi:MAG: pyridoxal-phosphate dependent enzyme, partial [Bacteroidetes bacterium]|nr:pyridoxal-phosphate dependent enzyme [Bacteroidota bacterium]
KKYRSYREHPDLAAAEFQFPCSRLYVLPEGGSNELAVAGCREICDDIPADADYICCDCGTGATLAGIVSGLKDHQQAIGIAVLKANDFLERTVEKFNGQKNNFQVIHDYHFGGYAKSNNELEDFCRWMTTNKNIPVEPVYTGKLFFAVYDLIRKDFFRKNSTLVIVHTGGVIDFNPSLQANNGMNESPETGKQPQPGFSG